MMDDEQMSPKTNGPRVEKSMRRRLQNREASARHRAKQKAREIECAYLRAQNDNLAQLVGTLQQRIMEMTAAPPPQPNNQDEQQKEVMEWVLKNFRLTKKITLKSWSHCVRSLISLNRTSRTVFAADGLEGKEDEVRDVLAFASTLKNDPMDKDAIMSFPAGAKDEDDAVEEEEEEEDGALDYERGVKPLPMERDCDLTFPVVDDASVDAAYEAFSGQPATPPHTHAFAA